MSRRAAWRRATAWLGFAALVLAFLGAALLRTSGPSPDVDLDAAWRLAMPVLAEQGEIVGRDVEYTYGPLAQLVTRLGLAAHAERDPLAAQPLILFAFAAVNLVLCAVLVLVVPGLRLGERAVALALLVFFQVPLHYAAVRLVAGMIATALAARATHVPRLPGLALAAGAAAATLVAQLLTGELVVYCAIAIVAFYVVLGGMAAWTASPGAERRRELAGAGLLLGTYAIALAAGELLVGLLLAGGGSPLDYPRGVVQMASGYAATMGLPWGMDRLQTIALVLVFAALAIWVIRRFREEPVAPVRTFLVWTFFAILCVKGATVRADVGHVVLGLTPFLVLFVVAALWALPRGEGRAVAWLVGLALLCGVWPQSEPRVFGQAWIAVAAPGRLADHWQLLRHASVDSTEVAYEPLRHAVAREARPSQPLAVVPWQVHLPIALGRPLAAPILQAYSAHTIEQQERYVRGLEEREPAPLVLWAVDGRGGGSLDGVQSVTRLPVVFAWALASLAPTSPRPAGDFFVLSPRRAARRVEREPLDFTVEREDERVAVRLTEPAACPLVELELRLDYPAWTALLRPAALSARFEHAGQRVERARLLPLPGADTVTTFVHLGAPGQLAALFAGSPRGVSWDRVALWAEADALSVAPAEIEVVGLRCVAVR